MRALVLYSPVLAFINVKYIKSYLVVKWNLIRNSATEKLEFGRDTDMYI